MEWHAIWRQSLAALALAGIGALSRQTFAGDGESQLSSIALAQDTSGTDDAGTRDAIIAEFAPLVEAKRVVGLAIGAVVNDRATFVGLGSTGRVVAAADQAPSATGEPPATRAQSDAPDERTIFEIGSLTKTFTGTLLAEAVRRGEMALEDPASRHLPESWKLPARMREITLLDLATHTSGLPRLPANMKPADWNNPYVDYSAEQLAQFLREHELRREPGETYEYSNLAFGLLGHLLANQSGLSYEQLVSDRLLRPLEMRDTSITLTEDQRGRFAVGHDGAGRACHEWEITTLAGAGALRSNAHDMLLYLQAQIEAPPSLKVAIDESHIARRVAFQGVKIGLGWHIDESGPWLFHTGQTGGYHSIILVDPATRVGLVVLANSATEAVDGPSKTLARKLRDRRVSTP